VRLCRVCIRRHFLWPIGLLAFTAIGCGDGMARVEGTVSLDGEVVQQTDSVKCTVTLKPDGSGPTATGTVDRGGRFRLAVGSSTSVPPGEYTASARVSEVTPASEPGGYTSTRAISAERYASTTTSGLRFTLKPGANTIEIAVQAE
jgi:hypothetical protein